MQTTNMLRASGIYQIRCISNNKIYVGSAINIRERCNQLRTSLRSGDHRNPHLQAAWDKYGEESNEITIVNLFAFCREHALDFPSMHRLAMGQSKLKSYKGWTHRNSVRQRDYVKTYTGFIDPEGNLVEPITNLAAFCREHGLDDTHMVAVAHGRLYSHQGWTYNNDRKNLGVKTYTGFISPNGEKVVIVNLHQFCRENNLQPMHMYELISGKRKSHKGWTWKDSNE